MPAHAPASAYPLLAPCSKRQICGKKTQASSLRESNTPLREPNLVLREGVFDSLRTLFPTRSVDVLTPGGTLLTRSRKFFSFRILREARSADKGSWGIFYPNLWCQCPSVQLLQLPSEAVGVMGSFPVLQFLSQLVVGQRIKHLPANEFFSLIHRQKHIQLLFRYFTSFPLGSAHGAQKHRNKTIGGRLFCKTFCTQRNRVGSGGFIR